MTWGDAAERVLRTEGRPLHYADLARKIVHQKLATSKGKTPGLACYSSLVADNKWRQAKGKRARFGITKGLVRLTEWGKGKKLSRDSVIYSQAQQDFQRVKAEFLARLRRLTGRDLERFVEQLIVRMGYDKVIYSKELDKKGVDLLCEMQQGINQIKTAVQIKNRQEGDRIGPKEIRYLRDVSEELKCSQGVFVTTGRFTRDAEATAETPAGLPIRLVDGGKLAELAAEFAFGITNQMLKVYAIDENNPFLTTLVRRSSRYRPKR